MTRRARSASTAPVIPAVALDQPLCIVGTVGSGKTYAAKSSVELLLAEGRRVVIVDPTGVWWGLRTRADGAAGYPVVIFGGEHADVPVSPDAGDALGRLVAEDRVAQAIVDVSEMSGGERTRFLTAFLERLYAGRRVPRHLVLDEADEMAPQDPLPETRRLQGIVDRIVRRGRVRGFRPMMITQRPAVLHKNVLSQIATLVALRLTSPQDRKAVEGWVRGSADLDQAREVLASLPGLEVGEGWVWAPREGVLERVRFPRILTLDTSATPDLDAAPLPAGTMADVDVAAFRDLLAGAGQEEAAASTGPTASTPRPNMIAIEDAYARGLEEGLRRGGAFADTVLVEIGVALTGMAEVVERQGEFARSGRWALPGALPGSLPGFQYAPAPPGARAERDAAPAAEAKAAPRRRARPLPARQPIGVADRLLAALAELASLGVFDAPRSLLAAMVGYGNAQTKSFVAALAFCRSEGSIDFPDAGRVALTAAGRSLVTEPDAPLTGEAMRARIAAILGRPSDEVLAVLVRNHPDDVARQLLASLSGYGNAQTKSFVRALSQLVDMGFITYPRPGHVRAADVLFPERRS